MNHHNTKNIPYWKFTKDKDDTLIKKFLKQGIAIHFVDNAYEMSSAETLHMNIDGIFSRSFSRTISEKVRNAAVKLLSAKQVYTRTSHL